jgi:hypothetical protein
LTGITRIAVLLSHFYKAQPLAVHIAGGARPQDILDAYTDLEGTRLFGLAREEANRLGYSLRTYSEFAPGITEGIRRVAEREKPYAVILGQPFTSRHPDLIADSVSPECQWPVVLVRIDDSFQFERVLVHVSSRSELSFLEPVLTALKWIGLKKLTILESEPVKDYENRCGVPPQEQPDLSALKCEVNSKAITRESILESITGLAPDYDLLVMNADPVFPDIVQSVQIPFLLARGDLRPRK